MASTMSVSDRRRWPVFFAGIGHVQKIFTAKYSHSPSMTPALASVYDDGPVEPPPADAARGKGVLVVSTHLEYPAIPNGTAHDDFVMMVHVKAPTLVAPAGRPSLDLVAVLDAGASMEGAKLEQVKRAIEFVVDRLGPRDRLSVVAFSGDDARRVTRLTRMSEDGKAAAKRAVDSLVAADSGTGSANVRGGLDEAAKVLHGSRHRRAGQACLLAAASAHAQQRGSSVCLPRPSPSGLEQFGCTGSAMFATPAMRRMERLSEKLRERQVAPAMVGKGSGGAIIPRSRLEARLAAAAPRISMLRKYRRLAPIFKR